MSSFYLIVKKNYEQVDKSTITSQLKFTEKSWSQEFELKEILVVSTRVDDPKLWASYLDAQSSTLVVIGGRIAFDAAEWSRAVEEAQDQQAIIAREVLRRYRCFGTAALTELNGGYCILIYEADQSRLVLCTDRLGIFPVFAHQINNPKNLILCTHPDVLAKTLPNGWTLDMTTLAEQLRCAQGVHPYTFYQEIKQLDAGALYTWNLRSDQFEHRLYWTPEPLLVPSAKTNLLVIELADALRKAVERRTHPILGRVGVFLSGGTDSRVPLFAASNRAGLTGITFYDGDNLELAVTKKLAERAKAEHLLLQRDLDYYPRVATEVMKIAGGMWNFVDGHYQGGLNEIQDHQFGTILSGCYADYLFKGLLLNRRRYRFFRRVLPFSSKAKFSFQYYLSHKPLAVSWKEAVQKRLLELYSDLPIPPENDYDRINVELRRLIPVSREGDFAARSVPWRTLPWDHYLCDKDVLDVYLKIPISLRINGTLYGQAVAHLCKSAQDIPNGNTGVAVDASLFSKTYSVTLRPWVSELLGINKQPPLSPPYASHNLWPNWRYVISHSPVLANLWASTDRETMDLLQELLGWNPWSKTTAEWGQGDTEFFTRILSLSLWYRGVRGAL